MDTQHPGLTAYIASRPLAWFSEPAIMRSDLLAKCKQIGITDADEAARIVKHLVYRIRAQQLAQVNRAMEEAASPIRH